MGKKRRHGNGGWNKKTQKENVWEYDPIKPEDMHNEKLNKYYAHQNMVSPEEWEQLLETMRKPLPITFRINESDPEEAKSTLSRLMAIREDLVKKGVLEEDLMREVEWYPTPKMCWQINMSRRELAKNKDLKELHVFMMEETERGNLSRQELVSMIPPLFLDVLPHHMVLDCCAAPGSKTAQLMEMLGSKGEPTGCVVANDMDPKRCEVLVRQTQRLHNLYPHMIVTSHNACHFPVPLIPENEGKTLRRQQFDRILADVVCSGDGTMRKSLDQWRRFSPTMGLGVHRTQVNILKRMMDLLREGGRMVYSTCSMNPVEDEAVLAHCISTSRHTFRIVDCSDKLPKLKRLPGAMTWKMVSPSNMDVGYDKYEDVPPEILSKEKWKESMFPIPEEKAREIGLQHSMKFLPHHQDTGGFFVAVLEKVKEGNRVDRTHTVDQEPEDVEGATVPRGGKPTWREMIDSGKASTNSLTYSFFEIDKKDQEDVVRDFALRPSFDSSLLYSRVSAGMKTSRPILVAPIVRAMIDGANARPNDDGTPRMWIVATGLKIGERRGTETYRMAGEAAEMLYKHTKEERQLVVSPDTFALFMQGPKTVYLRKGDAYPEETQLASAPDGCCMIALKRNGEGDKPLAVVGAVKRGVAVSIFADTAEVDRLRRIIGLPSLKQAKEGKETQEKAKGDNDDEDDDDDDDDEEGEGGTRKRAKMDGAEESSP